MGFRSFLGGSLKTWTPLPGVGGYPLGLVELREYTQNLVELSRMADHPLRDFCKSALVRT